MAKSYNDIGQNDDWGRDPRNGFPYSGESVQRFIKSQINGKVGSGYFDAQSMTLYFFRNDDDKTIFIGDTTRLDLVLGSVPLNFETTQYRIHVIPVGSTVINATVNQDAVNLSMDLQIESKELGEPVWFATGQDVGVKVFVDASTTGTYVEVPELAQTVLASVGNMTVDIKPYIPMGTSRVRFYLYSLEDPSLAMSSVWNVTLSEMYIEAWNNTWDKALVEDGSDGNYHLGGFKIVGTIAKTLHIEIATTQSIVASYARDMGGFEAIESPYFFTRNEGLDLANPFSVSGESLPSLPTGVYSVKVWLTSGTLSTEDTPVVYSVMYVASGETNSAHLVVMNNAAAVVNNYDESAHLCDYAVYNAGSTYGNPTITITPYISGTAGATTTLTPQVFAEIAQSLNYNLNLVTNSTNLTVRYQIEMGGSSQADVSRVDNADIFPSEDGAVFYLNTSLRANGESNREVVYNTANNANTALSSVSWSKMSWVDGIDGWTNDDDGRKCLMIPAGSRMVVPPSSFRFLTGENVTFEFCYRVSNVSDYSENIITIAENPESDAFMGIRIRPANVTVHSGSDGSSANDIYQGTNLEDEKTVHLLITIQNSFGGNSGYNLVTGYVNGVKGFQFSYAPNTIWSNTYASAIFGSDTADLYLYSMRTYGKALSTSGAENNWLNTLVTRSDKVAYKAFIQSVLKSSSRQIDYETIKNGGKYNFFVVEMTSGGANAPNMLYPDGGRSNIEMHFGDAPDGTSRSDWDWKIYDVETKGQGTTSMNYWLWNIRWRIDKTDSSKKRMVAYYGDPSYSGISKTFNELPPSSSKTVWFDGDGNHPGVKRITAKINFASSMQSHKMGATKAYNALHNALMDGAMLNEAQVIAENENKPVPAVAVYQYPAFGFQKVVDSIGGESYTFIGLFTIGPDKGDKPTFGYDLVEEDLVSLEGVDHTPQMTKFSVPWDEQTAYFVNAKGDGFLATKAPSGNFQNALEVGAAKGADTEDGSETLPILEDSFKPAYDVIYDNSTLIVPIALDDEDFGGQEATASSVLDAINAGIETFQGRIYNGRIPYSDVQFWIEGEYKLYHFEYENSVYVSGYKTNGAYTPLDIRTDTGITDSELDGLTLEQQNDLFKEARRARFISEAPEYWEMNELVFNYAYLLIFGATDNFAKNQYPYYMGGKWRFRQDDLDTIMDIDNNGGQTKPSDIEFEDTVNGSPYFAGSNSVLWNLVNESMWEDYEVDGVSYHGIKTVGYDMIETMSRLSNGNNIYDGFIKFFEKYFWENAQEYFPPSAYNIDGNIKYEAAWLTGRSFSANPLRQSLGSHYSAERLWIRRRAMYCMSLFGVGAFGTYTDEYLGSIKFRPLQLGSMTVTPAESMYPCLIIGDDDVHPTARTMAGESYSFTSLTGDGNTVYTLQAVDNLVDLGDLKDLVVGSDDGGTFNLSGKKLRTFKMGDAEDEVTTNVVNLSIAGSGLPCLEKLDVRNAAELAGTLDLSNCKRVLEVYTEGTKISSVVLPRGSKIEKLHLSEYVTTLSYQVVKYLSDLVLPSDSSNITLIYLEECDALDGMSTLESVYNSSDSRLAFIRIVWNSEKNVTGGQITMLRSIMEGKDKDGGYHDYNGVEVSGSGSVYINPIIEGELVADKYYMSDILALAGDNAPVDSETHPGMKRILANYFGPLYINYPLGNTHEFIEFHDAYMRSVFVGSFDTNHDGGVMRSEASACTNDAFRNFALNHLYNNSQIVSLDDLVYFTGVTTAGTYSSDGTNHGPISSMSNLESITLPGDFYIPSYNLRYCPKLKTWRLNGTLEIQTIGASSATFGDVYLTNINHWLGSYIPSAAYTNYSTSCHLYLNDELMTSATSGMYQAIREYCFGRCVDLNQITLSTYVTSIGAGAFYYCTSLESLVILATTPPTLSNTNAFTGTNSSLKVYVPYSNDHGILASYKSATNWSSLESKIYELNEDGSIPE